MLVGEVESEKVQRVAGARQLAARDVIPAIGTHVKVGQLGILRRGMTAVMHILFLNRL